MAIKICSESSKTKTQTGELKAIEIKEEKILWIKFIQNTNLPEAFNSTNGTVNKEDNKNQLGIKLHEYGLLRCHGRMVHAELPPYAVYPILLPKRSHCTLLLIKKYHQIFHSGLSHTLAQLKNEYWIPQGIAEVKKQFMTVVSVRDFRTLQTSINVSMAKEESSNICSIHLYWFRLFWPPLRST